MKLLAFGCLSAALLVGIGLVVAQTRNRPQAGGTKPRAKSSTAASKGEVEMVRVNVFNGEGKLVGPIDAAKLALTPAEWRKRLTKEQFEVLRSSSTERPFCGTLLDNKKEGVYACAGCGLPLFSSDSKFQSGTGWPSFFQPIAEGNVAAKIDYNLGIPRTEINCARCDGHLGHVFDDGPPPTGMRFCLNSASLNFTPSDKLATLADPIAEKAEPKSPKGGAGNDRSEVHKSSHTGPATEKIATAIFAGGCFWCTEAVFEQLEGVIDAESGYSGGTEQTANYERVSMGNTGHAEAIRIKYDPSKIGYEKLLDIFFDTHDPTQLNHQGADHGTQYRSAIFYANDTEKQVAEAKIKQLTAAKTFPKPIVTTLEPLKAFYPAEDYHQDYARNNPFQPYIQALAIPKACKVREKHPELIKGAK